MPRHIQLALWLFALSLFVGRPMTYAAPGDQAELLTMVRNLRADTFERMSSGRGVAIVKSTEERSEWDQPKISRTKVSFIYRGDDSLSRVEDLDGNGALAGAFLIKDKTHVKYWLHSRSNRDIGMVEIYSYAHVPLHSPEVEDWSFRSIAELPIGGLLEEQEVFARWMIFPLKVARDGHTVVVTVITKPNTKIGLGAEERIYTFNLDLGGMLTSYHDHRVDEVRNFRTQKSEQATMIEEIKTTWKRMDGMIVPATRQARTTFNIDGQFRRRIATEIEFLEFKADAIDPEELAMDRMGIPVDTLIRDNVRRQRWRYFDAAARERFSTEPSTRRVDEAK